MKIQMNRIVNTFILKVIVVSILFLQLLSCQKTIDESKKAPNIKKAQGAVSENKIEDDNNLPNNNEGYAMAVALTNPLKNTKENISLGKALYSQYCTHCHGKTGNSEAPMISKNKYPTPPLFKKRLPTITQGQMFHSIYYGKNQMPENKNDLSKRQIWLLITYISTFITPNDTIK